MPLFVKVVCVNHDLFDHEVSKVFSAFDIEGMREFVKYWLEYGYECRREKYLGDGLWMLNQLSK